MIGEIISWRNIQTRFDTKMRSANSPIFFKVWRLRSIDYDEVEDA